MSSIPATRWLAAIAVALLAGTAVGQVASTADAGQPTPPIGAVGTPRPEAPTIQNRKDKVSYAFGVGLARDLQRQKDNLNVNLLVEALTDALAGKNLIMSDEEVSATVKTFEAEQKQDIQHAKMMISQKNKKAGESFVADNAKKEGVVTLPSGLQYKVLKQGDGKLPTLDDYVVCHYRGTLVDGTEIDSSYARKQPATLPVKGVMAGWTQALLLMPAGSKWQIFIPPQLAYGESIVGGLGPNATLIFEVELISIQDKAQIAQQLPSADKAQGAGEVHGGVSKSQTISSR